MEDKQEKSNGNELLPLSQVSDELKVSEQTLRDWEKLDEGPACTRVGKKMMYKRSAVDHWLKANTNNPRQQEVKKKMGKKERLKNRLTSRDPRHDWQKITYAEIDSIKTALLWLAGLTTYPIELIGMLLGCLRNDEGSYPQWRQRRSDIVLVVFSACLKEKPKEFTHITHPSPEEAAHMNTIKWVEGVYKPLRDIDIDNDVADLYGEFLRVKQLWEKTDLFLFEMPAAYVGAGRIAVRYFFEALGALIRSFREKADREHIEKLLHDVNAALKAITKIAKEV